MVGSWVGFVRSARAPSLAKGPLVGRIGTPLAVAGRGTKVLGEISGHGWSRDGTIKRPPGVEQRTEEEQS
jgi:hypothetical protein